MDNRTGPDRADQRFFFQTYGDLKIEPRPWKFRPIRLVKTFGPKATTNLIILLSVKITEYVFNYIYGNKK